MREKATLKPNMGELNYMTEGSHGRWSRAMHTHQELTIPNKIKIIGMNIK